MSTGAWKRTADGVADGVVRIPLTSLSEAYVPLIKPLKACMILNSQLYTHTHTHIMTFQEELISDDEYKIGRTEIVAFFKGK